MCIPDPKIPTSNVKKPETPAPPPAPEPVAKQPVTAAQDRKTGSGSGQAAKKKGRSSLRIDVNLPGATTNSLNVPTG